MDENFDDKISTVTGLIREDKGGRLMNWIVFGLTITTIIIVTDHGLTTSTVWILAVQIFMAWIVHISFSSNFYLKRYTAALILFYYHPEFVTLKGNEFRKKLFEQSSDGETPMVNEYRLYFTRLCQK